MNNKEIARLEAGKRVQEFNTTHATQLATIPDYGIEQTEFNIILTQS